MKKYVASDSLINKLVTAYFAIEIGSKILQSIYDVDVIDLNNIYIQQDFDERGDGINGKV